MLNKYLCIGRIADELRLNKTSNNYEVLNFDLAVKRSYVGQDGKTVDFLPIVAWGKTAESIYKYCGNGDKVYIEGELKTQEYKTNDGKKIKKVFVNCTAFDKITSKKVKETDFPASKIDSDEMKKMQNEIKEMLKK